jgi:DNA-directed RNA polymerase
MIPTNFSEAIQRAAEQQALPKLMTQEECELRMFNGGIERATSMMNRAEVDGRAHQNPYAKELLRDYVLPLAEALRQEMAPTKAGRRQAHVALLRALDPDVVAYLTVRTAIDSLLRTTSSTAVVDNHRKLAYELGRTVHCELVLAQIEDYNPGLYYTLAHDFQRKLSKDERHRMTVFKQQAHKAGILFTEWPKGARDQVGMYLLEILEIAGLLEISPQYIEKGKTAYRKVALAQDIIVRINEVKDFVALTMPVYGPCVEAPKDWTTPTDGGYYTREMRRTHNTVVRASNMVRQMVRTADMPIVLGAVNALQRTRWAVNQRVLDTVYAVARAFNTKEIVGTDTTPKPVAPAWLAVNGKEDMSPDQEVELKHWKRLMTQWYEARKLAGSRFGRFYSATRSAEMFKDYPAIHFVYFADSRGRLYPMTYGLNPQGSDLQKAMLRFADGKPVDTPEAIRWFHVQGANKWGFDKATLAERAAWVTERQDLLMSFADDPVNNNGWKDADSPLQFLAWCFEYADWVRDNTGTFVSHLPISMDGSCNGLQNLSALLRDEVGGAATNLTDSGFMQDIYRRVAEAALARMIAMAYDDPIKESLRKRWIEHGINRSMVKRSVMTTPYGVTRRSAIEYVVTDYLKEGKAPGVFEKPEFMHAATILMDSVWPAIGDVVVKGREAMDWLRTSARSIVKGLPEDKEGLMEWDTPSGFPASQAYYEAEVVRIKSRLHGPCQINVVSELDSADPGRHASGLAPNFVHSMDAAHLHLTTREAAREGIDALAMIHDDYGTHAADAEKLYRIIREQFVSMYENHDPIAAFKARYPQIAEPPSRGTLDIRDVLTSPYFFS